MTTTAYPSPSIYIEASVSRCAVIFLIEFDPLALINFTSICLLGRSLEKVIFTSDLCQTTCHRTVCFVVSSAYPCIQEHISFFGEIEPSFEFTFYSNFLNSFYLLYTACCLTEIIISVSGSFAECPALFPCCTAAVWCKVVSVFTGFYEFFSVNYTIFIGQIIVLISCLYHFAFDQIAICIKEIISIAVC